MNLNTAVIASDAAAVHGERAGRGFAVFLLNVYPPVFVFIARILGNSSSALAIAKDKIAALNVDNSVTAVILHLNAVAVQAEVEGLVRRDGQGLGIFQSHVVRQVDVGDIVGVVGDVAAVPGRPGRSGAVVGRVVANVLVISAADGVVGMRSRRILCFGPHAGRAQQGTQAQHYTYDPFLPRHFVTRSSSRFISLRRAEGCGVYTPGLVVMGVLRLRAQGTDSHTSDIGHWFGMTPQEDDAASPPTEGVAGGGPRLRGRGDVGIAPYGWVQGGASPIDRAGGISV